ncbi:protein YhfH [Bacillus sp. Marseille-P3661]|nr:protein YhfH [Bacillus sp. Marseille-P3661]
MIQSPIEFFKSLEPKQCCECGKVIEEQAESYLSHCDNCHSEVK